METTSKDPNSPSAVPAVNFSSLVKSEEFGLISLEDLPEFISFCVNQGHKDVAERARSYFLNLGEIEHTGNTSRIWKPESEPSILVVPTGEMQSLGSKFGKESMAYVCKDHKTGGFVLIPDYASLRTENATLNDYNGALILLSCIDGSKAQSNNPSQTFYRITIDVVKSAV